MPAKCHTNPLFLKLQLLLLKFKEIFELQVCKLMHRYRNNFHIGNNTTSDLVNIHSYNTRLLSRSNYFIPRVRTNLGQMSFYFLGSKLWQGVPAEFKTLSINQFKNKFKKHLAARYQ